MIDKDIVTLILQNLYSFEDYSRAVLPHLKEDYFLDQDEKSIFNVIDSYIEQYNEMPSRDVILIELDNAKGVFEETIEYFKDTFEDNTPSHDKQWLIDQTEKFAKDMSLHNALRQSVSIAQDDNKNNNLSTTAIPDILNNALSVSFDESIGHDYINDTDKRLEFYHEDQHKVPFSLDILNKITNNGIANKSVMIFLGGPGTGKSMTLTSLATDFMMTGKNVLYITLEMSEERVEERIDSNLLDVPITKLLGINKDKYKELVNKKIKSSFGNIITKEYPTSTAHAGHFRYLLNELKMKKKFIPDVVLIDYLNICTSSRIKDGANQNSYTIIKSIAEEIRGLAIEFDVPIITATQSNRGGYRSSDMELTDISESFGTAATADYVLGLIATDELDEIGQIGIKVVKNRYGSNGDFYKLGRDFEKMRLYDVNTTTDINTPRPVFKNDTKGIPIDDKYEVVPFDPDNHFDKKSKFEGFKI